MFVGWGGGGRRPAESVNWSSSRGDCVTPRKSEGASCGGVGNTFQTTSTDTVLRGYFCVGASWAAGLACVLRGVCPDSLHTGPRPPPLLSVRQRGQCSLRVRVV